MTFAFGHLIGSWLFGTLLEWGTKRRFTNTEWAFLLFGALLPDADFLIAWLFQIPAHRQLTHSLLFIVLCFIAVIALGNLGTFFSKLFFTTKTLVGSGIALSIGVFTHLVLDMALGAPGIPLFWPSQIGVWFFGMKPFAINALFSGSKETLLSQLKLAVIEMGLGVLWLAWLWKKGNLFFGAVFKK